MKNLIIIFFSFLIIALTYYCCERFYWKPKSEDIISNMQIATGRIIHESPEAYGGGICHILEYSYNVRGKNYIDRVTPLLAKIRSISPEDLTNRNFAVVYSSEHNDNNIILFTTQDSIKYGLSHNPQQ